ncbi:MAG: TIGR01777 family oxidoreductase [Schleiferiaceae bacterium]|nr:TIGR01777 family oxidoreductase [Schleiferiaceae bacterium]
MAVFTITGATGSVGNAIVRTLQHHSHEIRVLSTRKSLEMTGATSYYWNPATNEIDSDALEGADYLIHLAGATVSKRWTASYKKHIVDSRVQGTQLLIGAVHRMKKPLKAVISASAIGYYGSDFNRLMTEDDASADDYLASVTKTWESYTQKFKSSYTRSIQLRLGIVLDRGAGVLGQLAPLAKYGLAAPLGSGKQWSSWIHVDDLARMFVFAATQSLESGAYNAVAPAPATNKEFTKALCRSLKRPMLPIGIPAFVLKAILGEMATLALMSQKVSSDKIVTTGFTFHHTQIDKALNEIYKT